MRKPFTRDDGDTMLTANHTKYAKSRFSGQAVSCSRPSSFSRGLRRSRLAVSLFAIFFFLLPIVALSEIVIVGADSWQSGFFCFRTGTGTNIAFHLVKYEEGKFNQIFTKKIGRGGHPPICLTNGVIIASSDGEIRKIDLQGDFVFVAKPEGFTGAAGHSGRLSDNVIFLTETIRNETGSGWAYQLYFLDISGTKPIVKEKHSIPQPRGFTKASDELIVVGEKSVERFKIP